MSKKCHQEWRHLGLKCHTLFERPGCWGQVLLGPRAGSGDCCPKVWLSKGPGPVGFTQLASLQVVVPSGRTQEELTEESTPPQFSVLSCFGVSTTFPLLVHNNLCLPFSLRTPMMINFMCNLTGPRDAWIFGRMSFWVLL